MSDTRVFQQLEQLHRLLSQGGATRMLSEIEEEQIKAEVAAILEAIPELSEPDQQKARAALYEIGLLADRRREEGSSPPGAERPQQGDMSHWRVKEGGAAAPSGDGLRAVKQAGDAGPNRPPQGIPTIAHRLGLMEPEVDELVAGQISPRVAHALSGVASSPSNIREFVKGHHGTGLMQITGLPPDELGELARRLGQQGAIGFLVGLLVAQSKQAVEGNLVNRKLVQYQQLATSAVQLHKELEAFIQQLGNEQ